MKCKLVCIASLCEQFQGWGSAQRVALTPMNKNWVGPSVTQLSPRRSQKGNVDQVGPLRFSQPADQLSKISYPIPLSSRAVYHIVYQHCQENLTWWYGFVITDFLTETDRQKIPYIEQLTALIL